LLFVKKLEKFYNQENFNDWSYLLKMVFPGGFFMVLFSRKVVKRLSLCLNACILLTITSAQDASQDVPLLRRIRDYWKEGDYSLAKKQILIALDKYPDGALAEELHLLLGDLYIQDGNFEKALDEYHYLSKEELIEQTIYNKALCLHETKKTEELLALFSSLPDHTPHLTEKQKTEIRYLCAVSLKQENKLKMLDKTIELFESCVKTEWKKEALSSLVPLYLQKNDQEKAASALYALSKICPDTAPEMLFKAALLTAESSPKEALKTFQKILSLSSDHKGAAAYNSLILQFQMSQFTDVVLSFEKHQELFTQKQKIVASHLLGKSLYALKDYEKATDYLLFDMEEVSLDGKKNLLHLALECAYHTQNVALYQEILQKIALLHSPKQVPAELQLAYLDLLQSASHTQDLIEQSKIFLSMYPSHAEKEKVLLNLGHSLYEMHQWEEAEAVFSSLIEEYPSSKQTNHLLRLLVNCAAMKLKESKIEAVSVHRRHWICQLQKLLSSTFSLSSHEKRQVLLDLARGLFQENAFADALTSAEELLAEFPMIPERKEIELMQALCYLKIPDSGPLFVLQTEKLLANYPDIEQASSLSLHLFNTYLQMADSLSSADADRDLLLSKAADHLYFVFTKQAVPIKSENLFWLAEHYDKQSTAPKDPALAKAIALYEALLKESPLEVQEKIAYKLCRLFSITSDLSRKEQILSQLPLQRNSPQTSLQSHLLLELARTYQMTQKPQEALDLYNTLLRHYGSSLTGAEALLERSKILFSQLTEEEKREENGIYQEILDNLKDLELRKTDLLYPLYLEAGLDYIEYKSYSVKDPAMRVEKKWQLLQLFEENNPSMPEEYHQFVDAYKVFCRENSLQSLILLQESLKNSAQIKQRITSILGAFP
jgi:tetratricopeptide (TPR) repeat protein